MADAGHLFGEEHVRRYRETGGEVGHDWKNGAPTLLLTTTGRTTGEARTTPLIYGRDGDLVVIVASKGGAPDDPGWYRNLRAHADAELQIRDEVFRARARDAEGEERERLWRLMAELWPAYDAYQAKTERQIPVVVLERV